MRRMLRVSALTFLLLFAAKAAQAQHTDATGGGPCWGCLIAYDQGIPLASFCLMGAYYNWSSCYEINNTYVHTCLVGGACRTPVLQRKLDQLDESGNPRLQLAEATVMARDWPKSLRLNSRTSRLEVLRCDGSIERTIPVLATQILSMR
jgi:hypothetical protein